MSLVIRVGGKYEDGRGRVWTVSSVTGTHRTTQHRAPVVAECWVGGNYMSRLFLRDGRYWEDGPKHMDLQKKAKSAQ